MTVRDLSRVQEIVTEFLGEYPGTPVLLNTAQALTYIAGSQTTFAPVATRPYTPPGTVAVIINFMHQITSGTNIRGIARKPGVTEVTGHIFVEAASSSDRGGVGRNFVVPVDEDGEFEARYNTSFTPTFGTPCFLWGYYLGLAKKFRGARVNRITTDQTLALGVNLVSWNNELEDQEAWFTSPSSQIVVQGGVQYVEVETSVKVTLLSTVASMRLLKNGSPVAGLPRVSFRDGPGDRYASFASGVLDVIAGDYFELEITSDTALDLLKADAASWMTVRAVR